MAGPSRWATSSEDAALAAQRKKEKEEKKRMKLEKQKQEEEAARAAAAETDRPAKRRRLSHGEENDVSTKPAAATEPETIPLLQFPAGSWGPCRDVSNYETLNAIEEGTYGWVSRAKDISTGEVVALKKLKMDYVSDGFPVTALREIQLLQESRHENVVELREVVMGEGLDEYVVSRISFSYSLFLRYMV